MSVWSSWIIFCYRCLVSLRLDSHLRPVCKHWDTNNPRTARLAASSSSWSRPPAPSSASPRWSWCWTGLGCSGGRLAGTCLPGASPSRGRQWRAAWTWGCRGAESRRGCRGRWPRAGGSLWAAGGRPAPGHTWWQHSWNRGNQVRSQAWEVQVDTLVPVVGSVRLNGIQVKMPGSFLLLQCWVVVCKRKKVN